MFIAQARPHARLHIPTHARTHARTHVPMNVRTNVRAYAVRTVFVRTYIQCVVLLPRYTEQN